MDLVKADMLFIRLLSHINNMKRFFIKKTYTIDVEDATQVGDIQGKEEMPNNAKGYNIIIIPAPIKPTLEQIIQHYKTGLQGEDPICLTCDRVISGPFTDFNGQIRCKECGTTYQWQGCHLRPEFLAKNNFQANEVAQHYCDMFEYIPLARLYWQEVHKRMPFGTYLQNSPITQDELDSFYGWLVKGAERFESAYEGFNWAGLKREYAS